MHRAEVLSISKVQRAFPTHGKHFKKHAEHFKSAAGIPQAQRAYTHTPYTHADQFIGRIREEFERIERIREEIERRIHTSYSHAIFTRRIHMPYTHAIQQSQLPVHWAELLPI